MGRIQPPLDSYWDNTQDQGNFSRGNSLAVALGAHRPKYVQFSSVQLNTRNQLKRRRRKNVNALSH